MTKAANDNDPFTFTTLGAATLNVVRWLERSKDHEQDCERKTPDQSSDNQKIDEERAYIEQRLRDIAAFEDRLRPDYRSRRKRN